MQATSSRADRRIPKWVWTSAISALIAATVATGAMWWLNRETSPTAAPSPTTAQQPASPMPPLPSNPPTTQAAPPAAPTACGPDQAAALSAALARYPADPETGWLWHHTPLYSNYDPCADLSTIVVTVEGATGSSPVQALMFHRGTFLGTGTSESYAFTNLDSSASTKDTVVLTYRSGQSCTACGDGIVTTVRYHWDGSKVQMLDPPPPG
ncbi:MAG TPA: LppP/LprE family lipoprotein [Nitrospira sp.]|nr:LppP/LprE family lipoprotein [Nitrospira sp.]HNN41121.1 LppP/LprE family lipoprotein [Nitrospira sp.]